MVYEGAVESAKRASNLILNKYKKQEAYLYNHESNFIFKILGCIDNMLYSLKLPKLIDCLIVILVIYVIIRLFK